MVHGDMDRGFSPEGRGFLGMLGLLEASQQIQQGSLGDLPAALRMAGGFYFGNILTAILLGKHAEPLGEMLFEIALCRKAHHLVQVVWVHAFVQQQQLGGFDPGKGQKLPKGKAGVLPDQVREVKAAQFFRTAQLVQCQLLKIAFVHPQNDPADPFRGLAVLDPLVLHHAVPNGKVVEIGFQVAQYFFHDGHVDLLLMAMVFAVVQQEADELSSQKSKPLILGIRRVGAVAAPGEVRIIIRKDPVVHPNKRHGVFAGLSVQAVNFLAVAGKNISGFQRIVVAAQKQPDLALQHEDQFDIRMVVEGVFFDGYDPDAQGGAVLPGQFSLKHGAPAFHGHILPNNFEISK